MSSLFIKILDKYTNFFIPFHLIITFIFFILSFIYSLQVLRCHAEHVEVSGVELGRGRMKKIKIYWFDFQYTIVMRIFVQF